MTSRANQDHIDLWVKHATHENFESLRAWFFLKLDNMVNINSISNTGYAEFSTKNPFLYLG